MKPPTFTCFGWLFMLVLLSSPSSAASTDLPQLASSDLDWLAAQIYRNECNSKPDCLTSWNQGEDFPSLGIGHFIWYRVEQQERFQETFPALLTYLEQKGFTLPAWLSPTSEQPWPNRPSFVAAQNSDQMQELRTFLLATQQQQTEFIVERFYQMLQEANLWQDHILQTKLHTVAVAKPPYGLYALIDYVHFKGEGSNPSEQYQGQGWGLLQVLLAMPSEHPEPLQSFATAAKQVLSQRVALAPAERNEQRWLAGWHNRIDSYLPPAQ
jgi:hypothetical protein